MRDGARFPVVSWRIASKLRDKFPVTTHLSSQRFCSPKSISWVAISPAENTHSDLLHRTGDANSALCELRGGMHDGAKLDTSGLTASFLDLNHPSLLYGPLFPSAARVLQSESRVTSVATWRLSWQTGARNSATC